MKESRGGDKEKTEQQQSLSRKDPISLIDFVKRPSQELAADDSEY